MMEPITRSSSQVERQPVGGAEATHRQVLIGPDEAPHFALRKFVIEPGGSMPSHTNRVEHEQYVLGGRARIGLGDRVVEVAEGDVLLIPAGLPHRYECLGEEPFEFICVVPNAPDRIEFQPDPNG